MDDSKARYRELAPTIDELPIYSQPWWLDVVSGPDSWGVELYDKGGQTMGALPYHVTKRLGLSVIVPPKLTQNLGPWIRYFEGQKRATRLSHEKEVFTELVDGLPEVDLIRHNLHHSVTNWLPFYWSGFTATPRYTYILDGLDDLDALWDAFDSRIRRMIRKAEKNDIAVEETEDLDLFLELNRMTYERQGEEPPHSRSLIRRLDEACARRNARSMYVARGENGRAHSALYCVHDARTTYYLMSGADPELRNSGANGLAVWRSIRDAAERGNRSYDFEGSMKESIERFFRDFGARQVPYFQILGASRRGLFLKTLHMTWKAAVGGKPPADVLT